ncbi:MAG: hypothetical protein WDO69_24445 [Pseudomonadota bacterium]
MALPFKRLLSRLKPPANDWVSSRFGSFEEPADLPAKEPEAALEEESAPRSQTPASLAARLFDHWFDLGPLDDSTPPQSGERTSLIASTEEGAPKIPPERKSRAS